MYVCNRDKQTQDAIIILLVLSMISETIRRQNFPWKVPGKGIRMLLPAIEAKFAWYSSRGKEKHENKTNKKKSRRGRRNNLNFTRVKSHSFLLVMVIKSSKPSLNDYQ